MIDIYDLNKLCICEKCKHVYMPEFKRDCDYARTPYEVNSRLCSTCEVKKMKTIHCPKCNSSDLLYEFDIFTGKNKGDVECKGCRHRTSILELIVRYWKEVKGDALSKDNNQQELKEQSKVEKPSPITPSGEGKERVDSSAIESGQIHNATLPPADIKFAFSKGGSE